MWTGGISLILGHIFKCGQEVAHYRCRVTFPNIHPLSSLGCICCSSQARSPSWGLTKQEKILITAAGPFDLSQALSMSHMGKWPKGTEPTASKSGCLIVSPNLPSECSPGQLLMLRSCLLLPDIAERQSTIHTTTLQSPFDLTNYFSFFPCQESISPVRFILPLCHTSW